MATLQSPTLNSIQYTQPFSKSKVRSMKIAQKTNSNFTQTHTHTHIYLPDKISAQAQMHADEHKLFRLANQSVQEKVVNQNTKYI